MAARGMLQVFRNSVLRLETGLLQVLGSRNPHDQFPPGFALAGVSVPSNHSSPPQDVKSLLDSIFNGLLWAAVPKRRRSAERNAIRKHGRDKMEKYATPRRDLVSCLECGHWHEVFTLCGNCYDKVREETKTMKEAMDEDDRLYNAPKTEVVYLYEDEKDDREMHAGKYIVEMDRKRPDWWTSNQLTKALRR